MTLEDDDKIRYTRPEQYEQASRQCRAVPTERDRPEAKHDMSEAITNQPDRFELFILGDGEKKVVETPDTRSANCSVFLFNKEDHTLATLLNASLHADPNVEFCGYRVPHPMFPTFELRIGTDGTCTPREALLKTCAKRVTELAHLSREFTKEWELRRVVQAQEDNKM